MLTMTLFSWAAIILLMTEDYGAYKSCFQNNTLYTPGLHVKQQNSITEAFLMSLHLVSVPHVNAHN